MEQRTEQIAYIGHKRFKRDTVAGTHTVWAGYGDVQEVPYGSAVKMLMHEDVWVTKKQFKDRQKNGATNTEPPATKPPANNQNPPASSGLGSTGGQSGEGGSAGVDPTPIVAAIYSMDRDNPEHFSDSTGKPKVAVVREMAGDQKLKARDVDQVWKDIQAKEAE